MKIIYLLVVASFYPLREVNMDGRGIFRSWIPTGGFVPLVRALARRDLVLLFAVINFGNLQE